MREIKAVKSLYSTFICASYQFPTLNKLVKDSGVYALSSIMAPLISLGLAPFLTHAVSTSDYGVLVLLNTIISLAAGITQMGLGSAFFRAYNYDYTENHDKRDIIATTTTLLFLISLLALLGVLTTSSFLATLLLGRASLGNLIAISGIILFVQNLTIPVFAWLRAESRAFFYSLLSISNLLITLLANIVLVGIVHWGIAGSLIATGGGYFCVVICTIPFIVFRVGIKIRMDIARNLLGFGIPLLLNLVSYWVLQLSDRYLLSRYSSFTEAARYAVAYSLGSALAIVVITPFTLAWPTTMFTIAKRKDAAQLFTLLFHWFSLFLLFAAFCLSIIATQLLNWLFPLAYHSVAYIIPIVAVSGVFLGNYYIFTSGVNIKRKTWIVGLFTMIAALVNFLLNLILIPRYGAAGAALSTLIAYVVLALVAYVVNQRLYPIAFEVGRFVVALLVGIALYIGSNLIYRGQISYIALFLHISALLLYICCLTFIGILPTRKRNIDRNHEFSMQKEGFALNDISIPEVSIMKNVTLEPFPVRVCMHVLGPARPDVRVIREATALVQAGYTVSIVDIESKACGPIEEDFRGVSLRHIFVSEEFLSTRFTRWMFVRAALIFSRVIIRLLQTPADIYHAHDVSGLFPCYVAAWVRRKPLIFDAHELPLSDRVTTIRSRRILAFLSYILVHIISRCTGVITVSPPIARELHKRYQSPKVAVIRNIPPFKAVSRTERLQQHLGLQPGTKIALYQGYIMANRGLDLLILAAKFIKPGIVIVMMGSDVEGRVSQLEALATREDVIDRVKIMPSVPYTELLDWTASADIGLTIYRPNYSPNVKMCLPNKLFEYFMAGLPVLTSQLDAITDLITTYDAGHVLPVISPEAIGKAINTLLTDLTRLKQMQCNALSASRKDLNWEKEKRQLIHLYQDILN